MARGNLKGRKPLSANEHHRAWLELVDTDGPFLAIPALKRVWPQGMPTLSDERKTTLLDARKHFESAWERFDNKPDVESVRDDYRLARDTWVKIVLRDVAGWAESLSWGEVPGIEAKSPNKAVTIRAQAALKGAEGIGALVHVIDPVDSLRQTPGDLWAANPIDRLEAMLRENGVPVGIVTDGRWWGLVCAREGAMAASGIVDALTWVEEPRTRDAFFELIGRKYIIGGDPGERLPVLFEESIAAAEEITEALGAQVRRAVELLIQSFSESAADAKHRGLPDPLPNRSHDSYEAAITVMMRTVFLLFAEERGLLPTGELFEQGYGISRELDWLESRRVEESEEALDATSLTWHRLLATSQALHRGASFENLRMPAYGGSLFDPERFPFLTAVNEQGTLSITVSDRVMLHVLRSVQKVEIKGESRRISFRDIDVEQIGYIYEGLLGYTAVVAKEIILGLKGALGEEPEIPLSKLEELAEKNSDPTTLAKAIRTFVETDQPSAKPSSSSAIAKSIQSKVEPSTVSALNQAVGDDSDLRARVMPFLGLVRLDLRNRPFVVLENSLYLRETPSRKNAGAHYTPKSLAEEVVLHALQPLCYSPGPHQTAKTEEWVLKSSHELLSLKVADIACGSGAFLVAAARYLAERVVEAWTIEDPSNAARKDLYTRAMRQVVASCLYGADINDMAVEMCKLSLWLVSLDRDLPFSFVDDKIFLGNSLLGIMSLTQLRNLHIDESKRPKFVFSSEFDIDIDSIISRATTLRRNLANEIKEDDPARTSAAKRRQLADFKRVTADLRKIADGVVAAGLALGGKPGKALDEAYENLRLAALKAYPSVGEGEFDFLDSIIETGLTPTVPTDYERWQPLHWVLEAPDVMIDNGGFDAIVGNPPFLGGKKISPAMSTEIREWLVNQLANGVKGNADLVAYFFLRASVLLKQSGTIGLIATNSVAQGETREVGLDSMVAKGFTITRAVQSRPWPSAGASLDYAAVWGTAKSIPDSIPRIADGLLVRNISTLLEASGKAIGLPKTLQENADIAFMGTLVNGVGFTMPPDYANQILHEEPAAVRVLLPYLTGDDVNSRPDASASRYVVNFTGMSLTEASAWRRPFAWVEENAKPARVQLTNKPKLQENWWLYESPGKAMWRAIGELSEVLVIALVSNTIMPVRVKTTQVFSHALGVFATDEFATQAVLSSSFHQIWAITFGSTLGTGVRYTPSDVFSTFPRPEPTPKLESIGQALDHERREIMLRRNLGLTKLYNLVNDSELPSTSDADVARLRSIHVELDHAVRDAYGWSDLELNHGFYEHRKMTRWTVSPAARVEILDRLLEENHRRADLESPKGKQAKKSAPDEVDTLFD